MMRKRIVPYAGAVLLATVAAVDWCAPPVRADVLTYPITSATFIDSRNNTTNYLTAKNYVKMVANALGTGSNDGSVTRGLFSLPADLQSIPAADVVSAQIYFFDNWLQPPTYGNSSGVSYTTNVVLHPLTQSFSASSVTWNSPATGSTWNTSWGPVASAGNLTGPFESSVTATASYYDAPGGNPVTPSGWDWACFDVTSLWSDSNLLDNGAVVMLSNEIVPLDPSRGTNYQSYHEWFTEELSNQSWTPADQTPYIVITTVPEPSALALGLSGAAAGLALFRRRMRRQA
jgi:hypothetical protein